MILGRFELLSSVCIISSWLGRKSGIVPGWLFTKKAFENRKTCVDRVCLWVSWISKERYPRGFSSLVTVRSRNRQRRVRFHCSLSTHVSRGSSGFPRTESSNERSSNAARKEHYKKRTLFQSPLFTYIRLQSLSSVYQAVSRNETFNFLHFFGRGPARRSPAYTRRIYCDRAHRLGTRRQGVWVGMPEILG